MRIRVPFNRYCSSVWDISHLARCEFCLLATTHSSLQCLIFKTNATDLPMHPDRNVCNSYKDSGVTDITHFLVLFTLFSWSMVFQCVAKLKDGSPGTVWNPSLGINDRCAIRIRCQSIPKRYKMLENERNDHRYASGTVLDGNRLRSPEQGFHSTGDFFQFCYGQEYDGTFPKDLAFCWRV